MQGDGASTSTVLEELIDQSGFKKSFLAEQAGLTPSMLSRLLHAEREPKLSPQAARVFSERLGVPTEVFLDGAYLRMRKPLENAPPESQRQRSGVKQPTSADPGREAAAPSESALRGKKRAVA